ncbi:MAG: hypothetical protein H6727_07540 [Myxococcales bacterium]|nr:hypothetical protein [Myxococcales bacterium]
MRLLARLFCAVGLWVFLCAGPQEAHAKAGKDSGFSLSLTAGGRYGFVVNEPSQSQRSTPWGMSLELMPSYRLAIVSFDLGIVGDFVQKEMMLRPGLRLHLGWLYFRLAMPVSILFAALSGQQYDLGVLFGAGVQIRFKRLSLIFEANLTPFLLEINNRGVQMPLEVRLGVGYHF